MIEQLKLRAYGKINLGLDVLGKRADGYHDVRMIMQTVGIYDGITIEYRPDAGISVETNLYYLPNNENNLVYKAAKLLLDEFEIKDGVHIKLNKYIPVAAGMAGGSSDAAAVLFGINKMFRLKLSREQLMERGVKIGADVPYCILRGTALSEGIGEVLTELSPVPQCRVLIAKPGISVSTKFVYEQFDSKVIASEQHPDIDFLLGAIEEQNIRKIASGLGNVLESVTQEAYPVISDIKDAMQKLGAMGSIMSGSGPTVFGLFDSEKSATNAYEEMRYGKYKNLAKQVYLTRMYNNRKQ